MQACGHLYLDEGEELEVGQSKENLLAFEAFIMSNSSGQVRPASAALLLVSIQIAIACLLSVDKFAQFLESSDRRLASVQMSLSWPGAFGGRKDIACRNSTAWPIVDNIVLLGASVQGNLSLQASQYPRDHSIKGVVCLCAFQICLPVDTGIKGWTLFDMLCSFTRRAICKWQERAS